MQSLSTHSPSWIIRCALIKVVLAGLLFTVGAIVSADDVPIRVNAANLKSLQLMQQNRAPASVLSGNQSVISAQVSAQIVDVLVDVGDQVKKGAKLANLEASDYGLALEQARATLKSIDARIVLANDRFERAKELSGSQYISADDLMARQTDVTVLGADRIAQQVVIKIAKNNVARTRLLAPFDAAVVARTAQLGSYVTPGDAMFELVQMNGREVEARVSSDLIASLNQKSSVSYLHNGTQWPLKLLRITPVVETNSGIQRVRLGFTSEPAPIGSSGQLQWSNDRGLLPADMLVKRSGKLGVFIADNGQARFHEISAAQEGRPVELSLPENTLLVTDGRFRLQDGQRIELVE